jgi:hypothetical protein
VRIEGLELSQREAPHLKRAKRAHRAQLLYRALWIVSGVIGGFCFLLTVLVLLGFSALASGWASLLFFPALPLLLAFWARRRTLHSQATQREALDDAWTSTAHEILDASHEELTSTQVAEAMLTDETHADQLLARLNVDDHVRSRITDDGEVAYSVRAPQRLRVGEFDHTQELDEAPVVPSPTTRTKL